MEKNLKKKIRTHVRARTHTHTHTHTRVTVLCSRNSHNTVNRLCKSSAFELWCWRRLLRVPWTARRSNQSILKEISPGHSLEGLMLKLKLQYFGHLMRRADSLEKTLMLGKIEGRGRRGWQRMRWLGGITDLMDMGWVDSSSWWWTERPGVLQFMGSQRVRHDWVTELNLTELIYLKSLASICLANADNGNCFSLLIKYCVCYYIYPVW